MGLGENKTTMSKTMEELQAEEDFWADFDTFLSQGKWSDCKSMIQNAEDLGYENLALRMHYALNRAKGTDDFTFEPVVDEIPELLPEEDDAPMPKPEESEYITEWGDDGRLHTFKK